MTDKTKKNWNIFKDDSAKKHSTAQEAIDDEDFYDDVPHPSPVDDPSLKNLEEKLALAEQKSAEYWEKLVRQTADLDNIRRRADRDVTNAHRYALEKFSNALLPVMDSLEQALSLASKAADPQMQEGLDLTMKLFIDVLEKFDVIQLNPLGEVFDPQSHEAMSLQMVPDAVPNTILAVYQKGYKLNDRVIRPARVVVAKEST